MHRRDEVLEDPLGEIEAEAHPRPARLDPVPAVHGHVREGVGVVLVDAEQAVAVGTGAGAPSARLDAEEVVEQRDHEVVVQPAPVGRVDQEGDDRQAVGVEVAEDLDGRVGAPRRDRPAHEIGLALDHDPGADRLLELEDQPGPDRLDDRRRAALLAVVEVGKVVLAGGVDVADGPSARHRRYRVAGELAAHDQDPRRARPADELVRGEEGRVLVRQRAAVVAAHGDLEVRTGGGVVPEGERAMAVEQLRDRVGVGDHPGDVGGGRERADPERPVGVADQLPRQPVAVDAAVRVFGDAHHVGDRLAPEQLVGMVLVGPTNTTGRARSGSVAAIRSRPARPESTWRPRIRISLSIAPVEPEPVKITACSWVPPTASRMIARASSRSWVVCLPVPDDSVWVLA
jgi:hypothetical protein